MNLLQPGWVGLGNMGTAIVLNLQNKGFKVNVFNRTKEKAARVVGAGAVLQDGMQQLVHNSSIIFTMVSDDDAVKEVYTGHEGLLSHSPGGKIFVDMSTVSPPTSVYLANICRDSGNYFIDSPVSGSIQPALDGNLIIMAGGPAEVFQEVKPLFDAIGKLTIHVGEIGSGTSAKLAVNFLLALHLQGLAETIVFAAEQGIRTEDMLTIINEGAIGNGISKGKSASILNNNFPAAFALKHLVKDLGLASQQGIKTPLFLPLLQTFQEALDSGLGEEDVMAIYQHVQKNAVEPPSGLNIYPEDNVSDYAN